MSQWDLHQTYEHVERLFDAEQVERVRSSLRSVVDRQNFAAYHFQETGRLLKYFQRKHLSDSHLLDVLHGQGRKKSRAPFEILMIRASAHITACIQSVHAVPDILASGIYFATGMDRSAHALSDRDVSITSVVAIAKRVPDLKQIGVLLGDVAGGDDYQHLSALSNLSKHRTIIRSSLSEDWTGERQNRHELHLTSFTKLTKSGTKTYPSVAFVPFLKVEAERLGRAVVAVGLELNQVLSRRVP